MGNPRGNIYQYNRLITKIKNESYYTNMNIIFYGTTKQLWPSLPQN
jgi:hypothetical protein